MMMSSEVKLAFRLSIPTLFAYGPLGMVFSILWLQAGFPGYAAPLISLTTYAGAVQFLALSMVQEHASVFSIVLAASFIALRNSFYGLSFIERFKTKPRWLRGFLMFGLVDATYAILAANPKSEQQNDNAFCFYVTLFPCLYWVGGSIIGSLLYQYLPVINGIEFILTAFFLVLVVEYYLAGRDKWSLVMPLLFSFVAYALFPKEYLLLAIIACVVFLTLQFKCIKQSENLS